MNRSSDQRRNGVVSVASTRLPTVFGTFELIGFERSGVAGRVPESAFALKLGNLRGQAPLVRMHSQCLTGEVLGSLRCDCRGQLELAMSTIAVLLSSAGC